VVFPARVFHVKSCVSCGLIPLLVVVYSPSFITKENIKNISNGPKENTKDALTHNKIKETCGHDEGNRCEQTSNTRNPEQAKIQS
jgi:hypothetical protein